MVCQLSPAFHGIGCLVQSCHGYFADIAGLPVLGSVRSWTLGTFQALAFAKTWSGKARLPNEAIRWAMYQGPKRSFFLGNFGSLGEEGVCQALIHAFRFAAWLLTCHVSV